ncbi:hypothetical protein ACFXG9_23790 [Streptomyces mirabilis]|uniref:hypothetical protein n=1 Tax=Streptomyces mirabilis TaxID=68239 RepID=UPI00369B3CD0
MVNINALACGLRKTVDQRVRDHEISLLLSYIIIGQGKGPLGVECSTLDSSAGHIQRFVSECTGLGVMTAASEALFDWKPGASGLSSFDVLPGKGSGVYAKTGVRPDLLYDLAAGPVAGDARGRRWRAKKMFPAGKGTTEQSSRTPWTGVQSRGLDARPGHGLGPGERQQRNPWVVPRGSTSV